MVEEFRATFEPWLAPVAAADHAPLAMQWCLAPGMAGMASLGPDGLPTGTGFVPAVDLPRRMWAGGAITTFGPLPVLAVALWLALRAAWPRQPPAVPACH